MSKKSRQPLLKLALGSVKAHLWVNAKLCIVFAVLSILVCLFTSFHLAIDNKRKDIFELSASSNYMYAYDDKTEYLEQTNLPNFESYTVSYYDLSNYMMEYVHEDIPTVTTNYVTLYVSGVPHKYSADRTPEMLWLYKGNVFNDLDKQEMLKRFDTDMLYRGQLPQKAKEALVSEKMLLAYGLTAEQVIGREITIGLGEDSIIPDELLNNRILVTGVIVKEYYELSGHSQDTWQIAPAVVFADSNTVLLPPKTMYVYAFDSWANLTAGQLNHITGEGQLNYCGIQNYHDRAFLSNIKTVVVNMYVVIGSIIAAALLLTIMLMIGKFVNIFARTGGILLGFGLEQSNLRNLLFVQILLMFLMSLPIALIGTLVGDTLIVELIALGTGMAMTVSTQSLLTLLVLSVATVFVVATLFFAFAWLRLRTKSVKQLLTSQVD